MTYQSLDPYLTLSFTKDSMTNTSLIGKPVLNSGSKIEETVQYDVSTDALTGYHTTITCLDDYNASGSKDSRGQSEGKTSRVVAQIRKKDILPDTIAFGSGKQVSMKKWFVVGTERFV